MSNWDIDLDHLYCLTDFNRHCLIVEVNPARTIKYDLRDNDCYLWTLSSNRILSQGMETKHRLELFPKQNII